MNKIEIFGIPFLQKGGIHIKNGKSLEKEDSIRLSKVKPIYSGDVSDEEFFNRWKFKKDDSDVADYFNSYLNSEGFKRIINNQNKWWELRHPYRKYYSNPDKGTLKWFNTAKKVEPNRYLAEMPAALSQAIETPLEEQRLTIVGTTPGSYLGVLYYPLEALGHEYAHGKAPFNLFGTPNFHKESALAEALDQNKNTAPGHDSRLLEKHADLWGIRYLFYKEGIYDSRSGKDITTEEIQKLRDKYPNLRPFKQMNNEQLLFLLNHVAQNDKQSEVYYAKSGIKIKKENKGKFTDYCDGKVTQKCIDKAKKSGNKKLIKRAVFAENSRKWKHESGAKIHKPFGNRSILDNGWIPTKELKKKHLNGGLILKFQKPASPIKRLDVDGLRNDPEYKKNFNWKMHDANLALIQDSLIARNADFPERVAILGLVIPESGGYTEDHGNGAAGYVGWRGPRAVNLPKDAPGQAHKLMSEIYDNPTAKDWSHGGIGTGVQTGKEMMNLFLNTLNVQQAGKAFMKGYVRPEKSEWEKRLLFLNLLKKHMK